MIRATDDDAIEKHKAVLQKLLGQVGNKLYAKVISPQFSKGFILISASYLMMFLVLFCSGFYLSLYYIPFVYVVGCVFTLIDLIRRRSYALLALAFALIEPFLYFAVSETVREQLTPKY
jgi:hypothetical protein